MTKIIGNSNNKSGSCLLCNCRFKPKLLENPNWGDLGAILMTPIIASASYGTDQIVNGMFFCVVENFRHAHPEIHLDMKNSIQRKQSILDAGGAILTAHSRY